jgi:hypothetical protein
MRLAASTRAANVRRGGEFQRGEGHASSWAGREANAPGTRILIGELLEGHREQLNELFRLTLDLIESAFQARKIFVVRGVIVDGGPDHYARLKAAKLFIRLISSWR